MRILLVTMQLAIVGVLYNLVAVPLLMMVSGLVYALAVATETVFMAIGMGVADVVLPMLPLFPSMSGAAGGGSIILAAGGALSQAATVTLAIASPFLAAVLVNLVCGFLARYRGWFGKMRRLAVIGNLVCLACYLVPQLVLLTMAFYSVVSPPETGAGMTLGGAFLLVLIAIVWDAYFFITLFLWRRMPERPDADTTARRLPAAHRWLCAALVAGFALVLYVAGAFLGGFLTVAACAILCLSALLLLANARASKRIALERKKRFALPVFLVTVAAATVFLVLIPPVGTLFLLSAALLYFLLETVFFDGGARASETGTRRYDA